MATVDAPYPGMMDDIDGMSLTKCEYIDGVMTFTSRDGGHTVPTLKTAIKTIVNLRSAEIGIIPAVVNQWYLPFVSNEKLTDPATKPTATASCPAWSPDGTRLAVASSTSPYLLIYSLSDGLLTLEASPTLTGTINDIAWSPDGQYLAVALSVSPYVTVYSRVGSTYTKVDNPTSLPPDVGQSVSWSPTGDALSLGHAGSPYMTTYNWSSGFGTKWSNPSSLPNASFRAMVVSWSPNGNHLIVIGDSGLVKAYKRNGTTLVPLLAFDDLSGAVSVSWHPSGEYLMFSASIPSPEHLVLYSRNSDSFVKYSGNLPVSPSTSPLSYSPDGRYISISNMGSTSGIIGMFAINKDVLTPIPSLTISGPPDFINDAVWSPDGKYLACTHTGTPFFSVFTAATPVYGGVPKFIELTP